MRNYLQKHLLGVVMTIAGGIGGLLYWKFIGCKSGTCPIKSVWYLSTLWGLVMGYLAGSIIEDIIEKVRNRNKNKNDSNPEDKN
ncbi:MAG: DUF6132 family protein [Bacteroidales bacterium]|jgi:hypothetical protein|nr:DUF6132 family protein [Bacteroidales bacterium]MCU0409092.1 DUF6132 family protein [Bacteroidales bacterium]